MHLFSQTLTLALQSLNGSSSGKTAIRSQTFIQTINLKKINGSPSMIRTDCNFSVHPIHRIHLANVATWIDLALSNVKS